MCPVSCVLCISYVPLVQMPYTLLYITYVQQVLAAVRKVWPAADLECSLKYTFLSRMLLADTSWDRSQDGWKGGILCQVIKRHRLNPKSAMVESVYHQHAILHYSCDYI